MLLGADHAAFVAVARVRNGRIFHIGHEGIMQGGFGGGDDRGTLISNAVRWLGQGAVATVGVQGARNELRTFLMQQGFTVVSAGPTDLANVDVWVTDSYGEWSATQLADIDAFIDGGGGIMMGGHAWWWGYSNDNAAENYPGNKLFNHLDAGLTVTTETAVTGAQTIDPAARYDLVHALVALEQLGMHVANLTVLTLDEQRIASGAVRRALGVLPIHFPYFSLVAPLRPMLPPGVPTAANPIEPDTMPIRALSVSIDNKYAQELPAAQVTPHAAAATFPGPVAPNVPTVTETLTIEATFPGRPSRYIYSGAGAPAWRSTGLYLPAGQVATVAVPAGFTNVGLDIQIGSHSDRLWGRPRWERFPELVRRYPIEATSTQIASAFGGLVYIRVPPTATLGSFAATVTGAIPAPRYVHGSDTNTTWASDRDAPAPWAEIGSDKFVITLRAADARVVNDPEALMGYWDDVLDADADLARVARDRPREERLVADQQISAGWLHSGYPIMGHLVHGPEAVDLATLQQSGSWGVFHELGHNHQNRHWELRGTTEATVNLWSVYAMETVVGLTPRTGHPALAPADRDARITSYINGGRNMTADWSVWTALESYLQLQEAFGWSFFETLNDQYNGLTAAQAPATNDERIQMWIVRTSNVSGFDLVPFFEAWGFPVDAATRAATSGLPTWTADPMIGR